MKSFQKSTLILSFLFALTACGGGGGDTGTATTGKYSGTYSYCDGDHTRYKVVFTDTGNENYKSLTSEITYQNANCTGTVLATYSETVPSTLTFQESSIATVNVPNLGSSLKIDKYKINIPKFTATLSGPGVVNGNCVKYPNGQFCYTLDSDAEQLDVGFYSSSNGVYPLVLENGVYTNTDGDVLIKE